MNIKRVIFPAAKDRPKTRYLKLGLRRLDIPFEQSEGLMMKFRPPANRLGPYVYPMEFVFDKGRQIILYDINTTKMLYRGYLRSGYPYFKIHVKTIDVKQYGVIPVPNTPSRIDFIDNLSELRSVKDNKVYDYDFFFSGWCSAVGLRIKACRMAKHALKDRAYCGLQDFKHHKKAPPAFKKTRMKPLTHWLHQVASKVNLALPGGGALPWTSFRHVELWGIGAAVFTCPADHFVFGRPKKCWIAFKKDFSDFKKTLNYYISHDDEREEIAANGRDYFDKYYTPERQAEIFIKSAEKAMK